jgi:hypothetical protein
MSVFYKQLEMLKESQELALFKRDVQAEKDDVEGFIRDFNEDWLLLDVVNDQSGKYDGIRILQTNQITQVRWQSQGLKTLKLMVQENYKPLNKGKIDISNISSILNDVQKLYLYINIHLDEIHSGACFIGQIVEMDDQCLVMDEFPTHSSTEISRSLFRITEITRIDAGAPYEENINLIARKHRLR